MVVNQSLIRMSDAELGALTPLDARALVIDCFFRAQRETFHRNSKKLKLEISEEDLRRNVEGAVRFAFQAARADFEHPTKAMLMAVVQVLAAKATLLGTPPDIIAHHRQQLGRLFEALPDDAAARSGEVASRA
jgi:hypothetical protein